MKRSHTVFFSALCAVAAVLRADDGEPQECPRLILSAFKERPSRFQFGGNYAYVHIQPKGESGFNGNLGGAQGLYEYRPIDSFYGALKGLWRQGNTTSATGERYLIDVDVQERFGYSIATEDERYLVSVFTGFGYRYLGHNLTEGGATLELNYNEFYLPVGFLADYAVNSILSLGVYVTWMPQVNPTLTLVPTGGAQWILDKRYMNFLVELPLTISRCSDHQFSVILKPFYQFWQDGMTTARTSSNVPLGVPQNTYNFAGIEVNLGYQF